MRGLSLLVEAYSESALPAALLVVTAKVLIQALKPYRTGSQLINQRGGRQHLVRDWRRVQAQQWQQQFGRHILEVIEHLQRRCHCRAAMRRAQEHHRRHVGMAESINVCTGLPVRLYQYPLDEQAAQAVADKDTAAFTNAGGGSAQPVCNCNGKFLRTKLGGLNGAQQVHDGRRITQ